MSGVKQVDSRVAEVPAEMALCDGKQSVVGDSQRDPVYVGPRIGTETGMEIIRHTEGTGDSGRVTK